MNTAMTPPPSRGTTADSDATTDGQAAVVGRTYSVPCVFVDKRYRTGLMPRDGWVPVLGPKHEDSEHLNFPWEHHHIDWRFVGDRQFAAAAKSFGPPQANVLTSASGYMKLGPVVMKRRKCKRVMPTFPSAGSIKSGFSSLERAHQCLRLKPGGICPHRGIDLRPFAQADGTAVCPGHGLRWNLATGELMRHHEPEPSEEVPLTFAPFEGAPR